MTDFLFQGTTSPVAGTSVFSTDEASLVINGAGRIEVCSAQFTASLGWPAGTLVGLPVSTVIAKLPFAVNTPGYNLAYAAFHSAEGVWIRSIALSSRGMKVPVDIALSRVNFQGNHCIGISLRPPLNLRPPSSPSVKNHHDSPELTPMARTMKSQLASS